MRRTPILIGVVAVLVLAFALGVWQFYMRRPIIEPASVEKMAYSLPDKPSIAILPFKNISGDPEQEYIVDGITENIITRLSQVPRLFVIAWSSTQTYKGNPVKIKKVSEDLGVQYVVKGSVQKAGDRLRINAKLIDATKGHYLWAKGYDRELKDILVLQDEITMKVITELKVKLMQGEAERIWAKGTDNLDAYLRNGKAALQLRRLTKEGNNLARQMAEEVIDLDPKWKEGYQNLQFTNITCNFSLSYVFRCSQMV